MVRIETDPNYSNPTFSRATGPTDPFKKEDVQQLAAALSAHTHNGSGKGLAVAPAANSIPGSAIVDSSLTSAKIADASIVGTDLVANTVTGDKIAAQTIVGGNIVPGTLTGGHILDGSLTGADLAAATVAASNLAAGAALGNLADRSIVNSVTSQFSAALAISSSSFAATLDAINYTPTNPNGLLLALYMGTFASSVAGAISGLALGWRGVLQLGAQHWMPGVGSGVFFHLFSLYASGSGGGTLALYLNTNAGTLTASGTRQLTIVEFAK